MTLPKKSGRPQLLRKLLIILPMVGIHQ